MKKWLSLLVAVVMMFTSIINPVAASAAGTKDKGIDTSAELQAYLTEKVDAKYIPKKSHYLEAQVLYVNQSMYDAKKLDEFKAHSFDEIFAIKDKNGFETAQLESLLMQQDTYIGLFDFDKSNDYLVGFADTTRAGFDGAAQAIDAELAYNNDLGMNVSGYHYDKATGIVYVPKALFLEKADNVKEITSDTSILRMQMLVPVTDQDVKTETLVSVNSSNANVRDDAAIQEDIIFDNTTKIEVAGVSGVDKKNIDIHVNGTDEPITEDSFHVENDKIEIAAPPATVQSVEVTVKGNTVGQKIRDAVTKRTTAAIKFKDWGYFKTVNGDTLTWDEKDYEPVPRYVASGSSIKGTNEGSRCVTYSNVIYGDWEGNSTKTNGVGGGGSNVYCPSIEPQTTLNKRSLDLWLEIKNGDKYNASIINAMEKTPDYQWRNHLFDGINTAEGEKGYHSGGKSFFNSLKKTLRPLNGSHNGIGMYCAHISKAAKTGDIPKAWNHKDLTMHKTGTVLTAWRTLYVDRANEYMIIGIANSAIGGQATAAAIKVHYKPTAWLQVKKKAAEATDKSLSGAVYYVYTDSDCKTRAKDVNGDRISLEIKKRNGEYLSQKVEVRPGTYYVKEKTAPLGFCKDKSTHKAVVKIIHTKDDPKVVTSIENLKDGLDPFVLKLQKINTETGEEVVMNNLGDAKFEIKYFKEVRNTKEELDSLTPERTWIYKTDEGGHLNMDDEDLFVSGDPFYKDSDGVIGLPETGTVLVTEIEAPKDYLINPEPLVIPITQETAEATFANIYKINEKPIMGGVSVQKVFKDTGDTDPIGAATVEGAEFEITNNNEEDPVYVGENKFAPGEVVMTITTDGDGLATTGRKALPAGKYKIEESKASPGCKINTEWVKEFEIKEDDDFFEFDGEDSCNEDIKYGAISIIKRDEELKTSESVGGKGEGEGEERILDDQYPHLSGIKFAIYNKNGEKIKIGDTWYEPDEGIMTITTKWNGEEYIASTGQEALPFGKYSIKELPKEGDSEPENRNETYTISDKEFEVEINSSEETTVDIEGKDLIAYNRVVRGDIKLQKVGLVNAIERNLSVPFEITSAATGEKHIIVTDENGIYDSSVAPHETKTNANDGLVEGPQLKDFDLEAGTWFGVGDNGTKTEPNNKYGAFPYGHYTARELVCANNILFNMESFEFDVTKDGEVKDLKKIENKPKKPTVQTTATGKVTGSHMVPATKEAEIVDMVHMERLEGNEVDGKEYKLKGVLVDKETKEEVAQETKEFTATSITMDVPMTFKVDMEKNQGKEFVVFEYLLDGEEEAAKHEDINDKGQTVYIPEVGTTLTGESDKLVPADAKITLTDTVEYKNVEPEKEYTIKGILMDKETKEPIKNKDGSDVTGEATFTSNASGSGTKDVEFTIDTSNLSGKTLVAFETLCINGNVELASHEDIEDEAQTVHIPKIGTQAVDADTKDQVGSLESGKIEDTVSYENLIPGMTYTLKGYIVDKETEEAVSKEVTHTFTPEKASGEEIVTIEFNKEVKGKTFVVFETLCYEGKEFASHKDITAKEQSVYYPEIATQAVDNNSGTQAGTVDELITITDTVHYTNLIPGKDYTLKAKLMDKTTGLPLVVDGKEITGETELKNVEKAEGDATVEFVFNSSVLQGKTVVAFEELHHEGIPVAIHADIDDHDQSVFFPDMGTTATDKETGTHQTKSGKATIVDTVAYENLIPGDYIMRGRLIDKKTGKELKTKDGKPITAEKPFTVTETVSGTVELEFKVDASNLKGGAIVVYENLCVGDNVILKHENPEDENQTVYVPEIKTTAVDKSTKEHVGQFSKKATIVDTVSYKNLIPGATYKMEGILMDKKTGKPVNGKKESVEFQAKAEDGTVDIAFSVDNTKLVGKTIVVFEKLYMKGKEVTSHEDLKDKAQSIYNPSIRTIAKGASTKTHEIGEGSQRIIDTVNFKNLVPGVTYTVKGQMIDKSTKKPVATASKEFTAKSANGTVEMEFKVTAREGQSLVAFEDLYIKAIKVASHADLNDKDQSVSVVKHPHKVQTSDKTILPIMIGLIVALLLLGGGIALKRGNKSKEKQR